MPTTDLPETIKDRRSYCQGKLETVRESIRSIDELRDLDDLCIYASGSFARYEASETSDLDLFFVHKGTEEETPVSNIKKTLLDAQLIRRSRDLGFPEFSGDGEYLEIHYLQDILEVLGSPADDYKNYFTARLLLLLESVPLHNEELYHDIIKDIVDTYYRDYHDHEEEFRPVFLANDIVRFWKTLCLNYEHKRNRPAGNRRRKLKNHLKNFKLKFSRLLTCVSMLILLSKNRTVIEPGNIYNYVKKPPLDRLRHATNDVQGTSSLLDSILRDYAWFLEKTGQPTEDVLIWIGDRDQRDEAFTRARCFGDMMYELLVNVADDTGLRYLVI